MGKKHLIKKTDNFSQWYTDVIIKSELADYAPVKGCQVIRPYGFALWENIQSVLDKMIKNTGAENAYFPLLIPEKFLKKEKKHVEGFSPELAVVTIGGGKKLKEKLIVRPTSETIINNMFADWIDSWRDLPLLINQWCNVVRWEMRSRLFLRTTEFLWQEGHTVHASHKEAIDTAEKMMENYIQLYRDYFAIAGYKGVKSDAEKFPGALTTYTYEMLMPDGKALQGCTSHDLGQNFAKAFDIKFSDRKGEKKVPWQTSWGLSTRSIGALIMSHGDNSGLVLPPKLAPIQVVVVPVLKKGKVDKKLSQKIDKIKSDLKGLRVKVDLRENYSLGWKYNYWEVKGVPLRIDIGEKELKEGKALLARRDTGEKRKVGFSSLPSQVKKILDSVQERLLEKSKKHLQENTRKASNYKEFKEIIKKEKGFIESLWCGDPKCEQKIKKETKATTRLKLSGSFKGKCVSCGKKASQKWLFAQAY